MMGQGVTKVKNGITLLHRVTNNHNLFMQEGCKHKGNAGEALEMNANENHSSGHVNQEEEFDHHMIQGRSHPFREG